LAPAAESPIAIVAPTRIIEADKLSSAKVLSGSLLSLLAKISTRFRVTGTMSKFVI
jgi:hypothetical protein